MTTARHARGKPTKVARDHPHLCPRCSHGGSRSRFRLYEYPMVFLLQAPYRCNKCRYRFWNRSFRAVKRLLVVMWILIVCLVALLYWVLEKHREQPPPDDDDARLNYSPPALRA